MNTINLNSAIEQVLALLVISGLGKKQLSNYKHTGFGCITKYFYAQNIYDVSKQQIDDYILVQRKAFEQRQFTNWKWVILRRCAELLKHYADTGDTNLGILKKWNSIDNCSYQSIVFDKPTKEQLLNPDNIYTLIWHTKMELYSAGLSDNTVRHYLHEGFSAILRKHIQCGTKNYCPGIIEELLSEFQSKYECGSTSRKQYLHIRRSAKFLSDMYSAGQINLNYAPCLELHYPTKVFAQTIEQFCEDTIQSGNIAVSTVKTMKSTIRNFVFELESIGVKSYKGVTHQHISNAITSLSSRYTSSTCTMIYSIRSYLKYLHEYNLTNVDLSTAVPSLISRKTMYRNGFTELEIHKLLQQPDRNTAIGNRDYAILILGASTGLRACDIANLKQENIDWRTNEICIVQEKTSTPLSIPLPTEAGNAIADYILNARPSCSLPYIFICHIGTSKKLDNRSVSAIATKYLKKADINTMGQCKGFHSFRRTFGVRLLNSEVSVDMISQLLGHRAIDSSKPYLSIDEQGLKICSLDIPLTGGVN